MKYPLLLCLMLTLSADICAQTSKNVCYRVAPGEVKYAPAEKKTTVGNVLGSLAETMLTGKTTSQLPEYTDAVVTSVLSGLDNARRLTIVEVAPDAPSRDYIVNGSISNISTTSKIEAPAKKWEQGNEYFKALVTVTLNLSNATSGERSDSHTFSVSDSDLGWMGSRERAIDGALRALSSKVTSYYNALFPLYATIIERGDIDKDKQKTVYIDLGTAIGATEGMQFDVFTVKTIAGREARTEIGRLKISKVMGDDISLCKVNKGDKQIKTALDNNETLLVISRK